MASWTSGRAVDAKANKMNELGGMVSMSNQGLVRGEAKKWQGLADALRGELETLGIAPPPPMAKSESLSLPEIPREEAELVERTRFLQLKIDYYSCAPQDYRDLFDNYLRLGRPDGAARVVESLDREVERAKLLAEIASNPQQEWVHTSEKNSLERLRQELMDRLKRQAGDGAQ